jgi:beta-glucanase (GH16 family)
VWRMDWTEKGVKIFLDDELINEVESKDSVNPDGKNPFLQPHYFLLNLAVGGDNGGQPRESTQSIRYEVDYVRVYQKEVD